MRHMPVINDGGHELKKGTVRFIPRKKYTDMRIFPRNKYKTEDEDTFLQWFSANLEKIYRLAED